MYGHKYHVYLAGQTTTFTPMRDMSFDSVGEALRTARQMFPDSNYSFQAC